MVLMWIVFSSAVSCLNFMRPKNLALVLCLVTVTLPPFALPLCALCRCLFQSLVTFCYSSGPALLYTLVRFRLLPTTCMKLLVREQWVGLDSVWVLRATYHLFHSLIIYSMHPEGEILHGAFRVCPRLHFPVLGMISSILLQHPFLLGWTRNTSPCQLHPAYPTVQFLTEAVLKCQILHCIVVVKGWVSVLYHTVSSFTNVNNVRSYSKCRLTSHQNSVLSETKMDLISFLLFNFRSSAYMFCCPNS